MLVDREPSQVVLLQLFVLRPGTQCSRLTHETIQKPQSEEEVRSTAYLALCLQPSANFDCPVIFCWKKLESGGWEGVG